MIRIYFEVIKSWEHEAKEVLRVKYMTLHGDIKREEVLKINDLSFRIQKLAKEQQMKPPPQKIEGLK